MHNKAETATDQLQRTLVSSDSGLFVYIYTRKIQIATLVSVILSGHLTTTWSCLRIQKHYYIYIIYIAP